jgi:beta-lactamase regulating signal transducer with metallopeptidase domain
MAELAACLYWFHPLVWLAVVRLRIEREHACDDMVLRTGASAADYASHLLGLARSLKPVEPLPGVAGMAGHLESRIRAILNPRVNRRVLGWPAAAVASLAAVCLFLPVAAIRRQAAEGRTVSGAVYDPAGARVPGANVVLAQTDTGQKISRITMRKGISQSERCQPVEPS